MKHSASFSDRTLEDLRYAAETVGRIAGDATLEQFRTTFELEYKEDQSPVTDADKSTERLIRDLITSNFPEHGIIGEEYENLNEGNDLVWVIDPIDGTLSFIHGIPLYTTLIGILVEGEPKVGVIYAPAQKELVSAAIGSGAWFNGRRCHVRDCNDLAKATFLTTDVEHIRKYRFEKAFEELLGKTRVHRTWGDAYGHMMVAAGRADIMFDPVLKIWDAAALLPVVTEAGGVFSDTRGNKTIESEEAVSTVPGLHSSVMDIFKSF